MSFLPRSTVTGETCARRRPRKDALTLEQLESRLMLTVTAPPVVSIVRSGTSATLTWQPVPGDALNQSRGYSVQQSADDGRTWQTVNDSLLSDTAAYRIDGLVDGRQYQFRVATTNSNSAYAYSAPVTAVSAAVVVQPISGVIATQPADSVGVENLVKRGSGTLVLNQPSTRAGVTSVEAGGLLIQHPMALGNGSLQILPPEPGSRGVRLVANRLNDDPGIQHPETGAPQYLAEGVGGAYIGRVIYGNFASFCRDAELSYLPRGSALQSPASAESAIGPSVIFSMESNSGSGTWDRYVASGFFEGQYYASSQGGFDGTTVYYQCGVNLYTGQVRSTANQATYSYVDELTGLVNLTLVAPKVTLDVGMRQATVSGLELSPFGTLDLGTGSLLIAPGGYDLGDIRSLIATARGNGWSGPGITSSSIQPGTSREVGYRVHQDGSLLVGFAAVGDANMDGSVNVQDLIAISTSGKYGSGATNAAWWEGDFNHDGVVNITDLINLSTSGLYGSGSYLPATSAAELGTSSLESDAAELAVTATTAAPVEALEQPVRQKQGDPPTQVTTASPALSPASGMHRVEKLAWAAMTNTIEGVSWNDQKPSRPRTAVR